MSESKALLKAKGTNFELHIYEDKIHIKSGGDLGGAIGKLVPISPGKLMPNKFKIDKEFLYSDIKAILFKDAGNFGIGYLDFIFVNDKISKGKQKRSKYAIIFNDRQSKKMTEAKKLISQKLKTIKVEKDNSDQVENQLDDKFIDCVKCGSLIDRTIDICPSCGAEITTDSAKRNEIIKGADLQKFSKHIAIGLIIILIGIFATAISETRIFIGAIVIGGLEFLYGFLGWIIRKLN